MRKEAERMTVFEAADVIELLKDFYPIAYAKRTEAELLTTAKLWASIFVEDDVRLVAAALKAFIASDEKGFPPVPGQIKAKMRMITNYGELTEAEAWGLVAKATKNSAYHAPEEFEKLPPIVRKLVGSPNQLKEWGIMPSETLHSVVASNFQRAFRTMLERERAYSTLTPDVKELVAAFAAAKALPVTEKDKPETPTPNETPPGEAETPSEKALTGRMPGKLKEFLQSVRMGKKPEAKPEMKPVAPWVKRNRAEVIEALRSGKF